MFKGTDPGAGNGSVLVLSATGPTSANLVVDPRTIGTGASQLVWVRAKDANGIWGKAVAVTITVTGLFADGFESGSTSAWSSVYRADQAGRAQGRGDRRVVGSAGFGVRDEHRVRAAELHHHVPAHGGQAPAADPDHGNRDEQPGHGAPGPEQRRHPAGRGAVPEHGDQRPPGAARRRHRDLRAPSRAPGRRSAPERATCGSTGRAPAQRPSASTGPLVAGSLASGTTAVNNVRLGLVTVAGTTTGVLHLDSFGATN